MHWGLAVGLGNVTRNRLPAVPDGFLYPFDNGMKNGIDIGVGVKFSKIETL